jgi:hypothetical protein
VATLARPGVHIRFMNERITENGAIGNQLSSHLVQGFSDKYFSRIRRFAG